ncbi:Ribosomal RNA small subunit methyltransferase A [Coccomyxa sp. Obi]|nr:Ribosomal RNA small subunit methyltransferase A [Coccomyxa sp. Obi]
MNNTGFIRKCVRLPVQTLNVSARLRVHASLASTVQKELRLLKITPKRSLGQNFVTSEEVLHQIIASANIQKGDRILEIGPGLGSLTEAVLQCGATVLAIEKDDVLHGHLKQKFSQEPAVSLIHSDVLLLRNIRDILDDFGGGEEGPSIKVVANIPYNITSDVLKMMLPLKDQLNAVHLLLEDGAARRLTEARPGDKDYRAISVLINFYSNPRYSFKVNRGAFFPEPNIDSAFTEFALCPKSDQLRGMGEQDFLKFVSSAFLSKRKTLVNNLKLRYPAALVEEGLCKLGMASTARAETLSVQDLIQLFVYLTSDAGGTSAAL